VSLILACLKMAGVVDSAWWLVFMPLWFPFAFFGLFAIVTLAVQFWRMRNATRHRG